MTKDEARVMYGSALKLLRNAQDRFAEILTDKGKTYSKHPIAPSHAGHVIEALKDAKRSLERASEEYGRALKDAKRLEVSHPGDKRGGKLVKGENVYR